MMAAAARGDDLGVARYPAADGVRDASRGELDGGGHAVGAGDSPVQLAGVLLAEPLAAGALGRRQLEVGIGEQLAQHGFVRRALRRDVAVAVVSRGAPSTSRATPSMIATPGPVSNAKHALSCARRDDVGEVGHARRG